MANLLALDLCRPPTSPHHPLLGAVQTPLKASAWASALAAHPDRAFVRYLVFGIREGFRIGFHRLSPLRSVAHNMQSALDHPDVVRAYLDSECCRGRMLGPLSESVWVSFPPCHINCFGVIPKGRNKGKWRLITDLPFPPWLSVNDGIDRDLCSLIYTSVDKVAEVTAALPPGAILAKIDIESAYRLVPVHLLYRPLQAVERGGALFVDHMLPFGLWSALADGLEWYLGHLGAMSNITSNISWLRVRLRHPSVLTHFHYSTGRVANWAYQSRSTSTRVRRRVLPSLALRWRRSPANSDSRLTSSSASNPSSRSGATGRRDLESLIGVVNHASKVVCCGRTFLRTILDLLHGVPMNPVPAPYPFE